MLQVLFIVAGAGLAVVSALAAGALVAPGTKLPLSIRFILGAAVYSLLILALLACHAGYLPVYLALGIALIISARRRRPSIDPSLPPIPWFYRAILASYGAMYLIFALAPEIQPDAAGYHLRLVADHVRFHALSSRIGFFDVLPQGLEMLFVPAFAIGAHSAAKLVHFAFLLATVPLIRRIAHELGVDNGRGCAAAILFFVAPVCGVAGTSAYTDAALVCACCAVLYLLIRWSLERQEPRASLLQCAALSAAFCYAIKPTFGWVAVATCLFIAGKSRKILPAAAFASLALILVLPWLVRAYLLSGSPVAPFLSAWFPNNVSTPDSERALAHAYSAFRPSFSLLTAFQDYSILGGNQGIVGPAFLLMPLSLLGWRTPRGRSLLAASCVFAIPMLANTGTRFLLPALAPASIALASVLPGPALLTLAVAQAIAAAPPVIDLYDRRKEWRLGEVPLRAALRIVPERRYLTMATPGFPVARMIEGNTPDGAKIFACAALPEAYLRRDVLVYWQSVLAQRFTDALHFADMSHGTRARLLSWRWPEGRYQSLRMTALSDLRVVEANPPRGKSRVSSWGIYRPGDTLSLAGSGGADLLIWPGDQAVTRTELLQGAGVWKPSDACARKIAFSNIDLRRDATAYIRRSGYEYILIPAADDAFAPIGSDMVRNPSEWGVKPIERSGDNWLFYISAELL